jgi:murein DD-endopeptidase MepM/ murein hydrolase activator NlpD
VYGSSPLDLVALVHSLVGWPASSTIPRGGLIRYGAAPQAVAVTSLRRAATVLALVCAAGCAALCAGPAAAAVVVAPRWLAPVPGPLQVIHGFDPPAHRWLAGHRGVDLAGRAGVPIRAAGDGVVSVTGPVAGVLVVAVRHANGLETTYQPVRPAVRRGQRVRAGQPLGTLVLAGGHCLPSACLHWGLRRWDWAGATPTSTRSASSVRGGCGCSRSAAPRRTGRRRSPAA